MALEKIETLNIENLLLDEENPPLPTNIGRRQAEMLLHIARTTSITEIMSAIAENDYFPGEPLIVLPGKSGKYIVVEGNRRLTALMLLQDPSLYPKNKRVQKIAESADFSPETVPCLVLENRDKVVNYLGYRHITGVKQWEPLSKARYLGAYFDNQTDITASAQDRYREVARGVGSQAPYIKRQLDALAIYEFMESKKFLRH